MTSGGMREHWRMFAGYNSWANRLVYASASALTDAQRREDRGVFFKSVHATLNHLLATDRIWLRRFTGQGDAPERLDAIVCDDFEVLRQTRISEDARIEAYVAGLDEAALAGVIRYRRVSTPEMHEQALAPALAHWFNHQTHHRGQVHALLTGLGLPGPELDLLFYQRAAAQGAL